MNSTAGRHRCSVPIRNLLSQEGEFTGMIPITQPSKEQVVSKWVDLLFSTNLGKRSTDRSDSAGFSHTLWRKSEAGWGIADFVEKAPKCVMLVIPHHPPRLAQLSGVFVAHSAKTSHLLVLMSQQGPLLLRLVLLTCCMLLLKTHFFQKSSNCNDLYWQEGYKKVNVLTSLGCFGGVLTLEREYYSKKLQGERVKCFARHGIDFLLFFFRCFGDPFTDHFFHHWLK